MMNRLPDYRLTKLKRGYVPYINMLMEYCQQNISITVAATCRALKLGEIIGTEV